MKSTLTARLLAWAATDVTPGLGQDGTEDDPELRWLLDGGLGPLLFHATRAAAPAGWQAALRSADACARVRHGEALDTALQVIDACERLHCPLTLLKGISVSEQFYPEEHLRPMTDIDVLIPEASYADVESTLLREGFRRLEFPVTQPMHHGAPLHHVQRDTIVELHTRLFPAGTALAHGTAFGPDSLESGSVGSTFHGRSVRRLGAELQLAYIAATLFNDLMNDRLHPAYLPPLFDAVYLLRSRGAALDWPGLIERIDHDLLAAAVLALLTYLPRFGAPAAPPQVTDRLRAKQRGAGPLQLKWIHATLDRHLIGGRPWLHRLPPPVPGRYSLRCQFEKRVLARPGR